MKKSLQDRMIFARPEMKRRAALQAGRENKMAEIILQREVPTALSVRFFTVESAKKLNMGKLFKGEYLESRVVTSGQDERFTVYLGLGEGISDLTGVKNIYAKAVKEAKPYAQCFSVPMLGAEDMSGGVFDGKDILGAALEGMLLACYQPAMYKSEVKEKENLIITLCGAEPCEENARKLAEKTALAEGIYFARDAVNMPSNLLRPMIFAQKVKELFEDLPVEIEVYDMQQLIDMHMEALVTVGKGSSYPPCLTVIRYLPAAEGEITALVGKGVTVDTGGYCVKPAGSMAGIKGDMGGAAGVIAAMYALAKAGGTKNTVAVLPMCENRISPEAMLPGDVISSYGGKTIEILNTDAEGRLILADAVAFAVKHEKAQRVLDIATLTGAAAITFGKCMAPVLADGEEFYEEFVRAQERSGERYVRLPFFKEHEKMIESKWADVKNVGGETCGSITAGLFIRAFVEGKQWLHLDIAGTAEAQNPEPVYEFQVRGGTGAGASTMYELCR